MRPSTTCSGRLPWQASALQASRDSSACDGAPERSAIHRVEPQQLYEG
jgi:hypothetical protein